MAVRLWAFTPREVSLRGYLHIWFAGRFTVLTPSIQHTPQAHSAPSPGCGAPKMGVMGPPPRMTASSYIDGYNLV